MVLRAGGATGAAAGAAFAPTTACFSISSGDTVPAGAFAALLPAWTVSDMAKAFR
jgi:hypothetical protein